MQNYVTDISDYISLSTFCTLGMIALLAIATRGADKN